MLSAWSWRLFQLAFILLNLLGIMEFDHPERDTGPEATADLLWFPTGGGKTEAYLGLTAYTLAMRRLQGDIGGYAGQHGVAVLMRYTLGLLTLQQFQRAAALLCACERIRSEALPSSPSDSSGMPCGASSRPCLIPSTKGPMPRASPLVVEQKRGQSRWSG